MSEKAFVLIETAVGKTKEIYNALHKLEDVKSVDAVTGPYDIIIAIEGADPDGIANTIAKKIHDIPGINRTVICLCIQLR